MLTVMRTIAICAMAVSLPALYAQRAADRDRAPFLEFRGLLARAGLTLPARSAAVTVDSQQIHLHWSAAGTEVRSRRVLAAPARRVRAPRLTGDALLVAGTDSS